MQFLWQVYKWYVCFKITIVLRATSSCCHDGSLLRANALLITDLHAARQISRAKSVAPIFQDGAGGTQIYGKRSECSRFFIREKYPFRFEPGPSA